MCVSKTRSLKDGKPEIQKVSYPFYLIFHHDQVIISQNLLHHKKRLYAEATRSPICPDIDKNTVIIMSCNFGIGSG